MSPFFRLLLASELGLVGCEGLFPISHAFLPLGGTELAQLGCVLVLTVFYEEIRAALKSSHKPD